MAPKDAVREIQRKLHDALVKRAFTHPDHAPALLGAMLPQAIAAQINWQSLRLQPGSFVDESLRQHHTDLLFTVEIGGSRTLVYVLLEHQSTNDPRMPFRVLKYTVQAWDQWLLANDAHRLPAVLPVVLYNGARPWTAPRDIQEMIDAPPDLRRALAAYLPAQRYVLEDLSQRTPESIRRGTANPVARLIYLALQRGRTAADIGSELVAWTDEIEAGYDLDLETVLLIFCYLMNVNDAATPDRIQAKLGPYLGRRTEKLTMTYGEKLIREGLERGFKQGVEQGLEQGLERARAPWAETLLELIEAKFGIADPALGQRVRSADPETLRRWTRAILKADSLTALLDS